MREVPDKQEQPPDENPTVEAVRYAALGYEFAGMAVAGILVGSWLDGRFGTSPLFILVFTVGGLCGGVLRLLSTLRRHRTRDRDGR